MDSLQYIHTVPPVEVVVQTLQSLHEHAVSAGMGACVRHLHAEAA